MSENDKNFELGQKASFSRTVTAADIETFARVTGDVNPIHLDSVYAESTIFKKRIAHGMLAAGFISAILGNTFPGNGTIYLKQSLEFLRPVFIGDTVTVQVEIKSIEKNKATLETLVSNQNSELVVSGIALVKLPK